MVATDPPTVILEHDDTAEPREVASVAVSRLAVGSRVRLELLGQRLTILGPEAPAPAASRGSNGNGHWWRDPSGLQVCWVEIQGVGGTNPYASLHLASSMRQYWCRPNKPKDKPFIERFIGTLQTECLDYHYEPMDVYSML